MRSLLPILASFTLIAGLASCEKDEIIEPAQQEAQVIVDPYTPVVGDHSEEEVRSVTNGSDNPIGADGTDIQSAEATNGTRSSNTGYIRIPETDVVKDPDGNNPLGVGTDIRYTKGTDGIRTATDGGLTPTPDANAGVRTSTNGGLVPTPDANQGTRTTNASGLNNGGLNSTSASSVLTDG